MFLVLFQCSSEPSVAKCFSAQPSYSTYIDSIFELAKFDSDLALFYFCIIKIWITVLTPNTSNVNFIIFIGV